MRAGESQRRHPEVRVRVRVRVRVSRVRAGESQRRHPEVRGSRAGSAPGRLRALLPNDSLTDSLTH